MATSSPAPTVPQTNLATVESPATPALSPLRVQIARLFSIDLRALAVFRILLAVLLLFDYAERLTDLQAHYSGTGVMPFQAVAEYHGVSRLWLLFSPYMWNSSAEWSAFLMSLSILFLLFLLVGYKTRLSTILCWYLLISLHTRAPLVLQGGDVYKRLLFFWSMFLPLGARFSIDGLAARMVAHQRPLPRTALSLGTFAIMFQVALVYWFNAIAKDSPEWRSDFTAVYYALNIDAFVYPTGVWLRQFLPICSLLTMGTFYLEAFGPFAAFSTIATERVRLWTVAVFLFFHLVGIGFFLDVGPFIFSASLPWVLFLPSCFWDRLFGLWQRLPAGRIKQQIEQIYEQFIVWRSRRIAAAVARGEAPPRFTLSWGGNLCVIFFLVYIVLWNLRETKNPWIIDHTPKPMQLILWATRVDQFWGMFAPRPLVLDGWYVIPAMTSDGTVFDLYRMRSPVSLDKPASVRAEYKNERWRKYLMNLMLPQYMSQRYYYCRWLAEDWNRHHKGPQALYKMQLGVMTESTPPPGEQPRTYRRVLYTYRTAPAKPGEPTEQPLGFGVDTTSTSLPEKQGAATNGINRSPRPEKNLSPARKPGSEGLARH